MKKGIMYQVVIFISLLPSLAIGGNGTEIFDFLHIPNGARCAALSGSSIGITGDPFALFSNPAALQIDTRTLASYYTRYIAGIQGGCGTYILPAAGGTFGVGINPSNVIGVSTKLISQSIYEYMGVAIAGDIGYLFYPKSYDGLVIGGTVQNLGTKLTRFHSTYENLPIYARLGGSYLLFKKLMQVSAEIELPANEFIVSIEWQISKILTARGGYYSWGKDLETGGDFDIFAGKSFGIGIKTTKFNVDYALTPMANLGLVHRISIACSFRETTKKTEAVVPEKIKEQEPQPEPQIIPEEQKPQPEPQPEPQGSEQN
ncbi:MAG: hypothetical protein HY769_08350 [Candidatus Stahlbacteria bacterium]|nr:hypothetical protein [Candidatus Stahlbacteria bacterium]